VTRTYVVDPAQIPWRRGETEGIAFSCQVLLDGEDGGPEALRFRFDPCPSVYAHMHLTSQFQVLLGGKMDMPRGKMDLRPLAVHYTDHNVPYGPFSTDAGHDMLVLHPRQGGLISMADVAARRSINLAGRLLVAFADDEERHALPGPDAARRMTLIPPQIGPEVLLVDLPARETIVLGASTYGRYEVVVAGSATVEGQELQPPGFRHVRGDEPAPRITAGPGGLRLLCLSFDADAAEGGLTGEGIAVAAAEGMARAI
jgi:hypothetical protein